jgi:tricarballylate dehydrogenase
VLEAAPKFFRGGNSRHTRNMRLAHDSATETLTGPYTEEEFWDDLLRVTGGKTDEELARFMIHSSKDMLPWIAEQGVRFQPSLGGTLSLGRTNSFFLGGGRAMLNTLYRTAELLGVTVRYEAEIVALEIEDGHFRAATFLQDGPQGGPKGGRAQRVEAGSLVAAAGGFEANIAWLKEYWGDAAENFLIRGSPYNRGTVLKLLLEQGVQEVGDPTQCHAVAIDARAPRFDGGIITRLDCVVFGIVVNNAGKRFYDEGEDVWPKRYAIWGRRARSPISSSTPPRSRSSCPRSSRRSRHPPSRRWPERSRSMKVRSPRRLPASTKPCAPAHSTRPSSMTAAPRASPRPRPIGHGGSRRRPSTPIRCGPASPSPISAPA